MSYEAVLEFEFDVLKRSSVSQKALLVELAAFNSARSQVKLLSSSATKVSLLLNAVDLTAFRALVNSVFRVLTTVDSMFLVN